MADTQTLKVLLWGDEIGRLSYSSKIRKYYFFFSEKYFSLPYDLAPLAYPKSSPEARFCIYGNTRNRLYHGLPPFIADSLPDAWGNAVFDRWFADNGLRETDKTNIARLSFIGRRAMGAFEFVPEMPLDGERGRVDLEALYAEALAFEQSLYGGRVANAELSISRLAAMGTSAGGRQKKAIVAIDDDGAFHSGQTAENASWRQCVLKFNTPRYCLSEIEYVYYRMLKDAGVTIMPSTLINIGGTQCFLTERFDRRNGTKVFTQTLAALNPEAVSYEQLFKTARTLAIPKDQIRELFLRTVFNIVGNNTDDHAKNFSFIMSETGAWSLAPAYDVNFIINETGIRPERDHCLSLRGKTSGFEIVDLLDFARENDIENAMQLIDKAECALVPFERYAQEAGIRPDIIEMINAKHEELFNVFHYVGEAPQPFRAKTTIDGKDINCIYFERTEKGNIHLYATIDETPYKYVFARGGEMEERITRAGFNSMSLREKAALVEKYLLPKAKLQEEKVRARKTSSRLR